MEKNKTYDFAGWATKHDQRCSDGVIIKSEAFQHNNGNKVPIVWNHGHSDVHNVLGYGILHAKHSGMWIEGYLNNSKQGEHAKDMLQHGDITHLSIAANKIKKRGDNVIHGNIYEVSLVLSGANPGAIIEEIIAHSDSESDEFILHTGKPILLHEDMEDIMKKEELKHDDIDVIAEKIAGLSDEEFDLLLEKLPGDVLAEVAEDVEKEEPIEEEKEEMVKHNVFETEKDKTQLKHSNVNELLATAAHNKSSMKETFIEHGITDIEQLFPEAQLLNPQPTIYMDRDTADFTRVVLSGVNKSPFARIKTRFFNLSEDEARARGYIKGKEKLEQVFGHLSRTTGPQTIYKKQALDRDDIVDITDFSVVGFINQEMRMMLEEEIARAIIVGDGREITSPDKIKEENIRPVVKEDPFYAITTDDFVVRVNDANDGFADVVVYQNKNVNGVNTAHTNDITWVARLFNELKTQYRGSGNLTAFIGRKLLVALQYARFADGRYVFGMPGSKAQVANLLGVNQIVECDFLEGIVALDLKDYTVGASKGGQITTFEDFDIDFNKHKYLIETRISGALTLPKSAIVIKSWNDVPANKRNEYEKPAPETVSTP